MKTFPIKQAIAIFTLLVAIFCTITFLPDLLEKHNGVAKAVLEEKSNPKAVEAFPEFRFSSRPKSITLKDFDDKVLYVQTNFESDNLHSEPDSIIIPYDKDGFSKLQLIVDWDHKPRPYHFFTMEFIGFSDAKFGTGAPSNIYEDITLKW